VSWGLGLSSASFLFVASLSTARRIDYTSGGKPFEKPLFLQFVVSCKSPWKCLHILVGFQQNCEIPRFLCLVQGGLIAMLEIVLVSLRTQQMEDGPVSNSYIVMNSISGICSKKERNKEARLMLAL
jgi:hypothetical protein